MITCQNEGCNRSFSTRQKLLYHQRAKHQNTVRTTGFPVLIRNTETKLFNCPYCTAAYQCGQAVSRHMKNVHSSNHNDNIAPQIPVELPPRSTNETVTERVITAVHTRSEGSTIRTSPLLESFGLNFNGKVNRLICLSCKIFLHTGIEPISVHLRFHNHNVSTRAKANIRSEVALLSSSEAVDLESYPERSEPLEGIPIFRGFKCQRSNIVSTSMESIRVVRRRLGLLGEMNVAEVHCQRPLGKRRRVIEVTSSPQQQLPPTNPDLLIRQMSQLGAFVRTDEEVDPSVINPFLRATNWHRVVRQLQSSRIYERFQEIQVPNVHLLQRAIDIFYEKAKQISMNSQRSAAFMMALGTEHEGRQKPFRFLQEESSVSNYKAQTLNVTLFIIKLLDVQTEITPFLTTTLRNLIADLKACLENEVQSLVGDALLKVWLHLISTEYPWNAEYKDFILNFYLVMQIYQRNMYVMASELTPVMAIMKFACRVFILVRSDDSDCSQEECSTLLNSISTNRNNEYAAVAHTMNLAFTFSNMETAELKIHFVNGRTDQLIIEGRAVSISDISNAVRRAADEVSRTIRYLLLDPENFDISIPDQLMDNLANLDVGYNFITDQRNNLESLTTTINRTIANSTELSQRFFPNSRPNCSEFKDWIKKHDSLIDAFVFLFQTAGGGAARMPELASTQIANSSVDCRTVFYHEGRLMNLLDYSKTTNATGFSKYIARYYPKFVSKLLLKYLILIRPFYVVAIGAAYAGNPELASMKEVCATYLFVKKGKRVADEAMGSIFSTKFCAFANIPLNVMLFRHVLKAFIKFNIEQNDNCRELITTVQFGHSLRVSEAVYARSNIDPSKLTSSNLKMFFTSSLLYHQLLGFDVSESPITRITQRKAIVNPNIGSFQSVLNEIALLRTVVMSSSNTSGTSTNNNLDNTLLISDKTKQARRILRMILQDETATFRSEQQCSAICECILGQRDIVVVLPTGYGKSLCYIIPAIALPNKIMLVLVPYRSLLLDQMRQFHDMRSTCPTFTFQEWSNDCNSSNTRGVVIATYDIAITSRFKEFLANISGSNVLHAIFVDEAHSIICEVGFRHVMLGIGGIRTVECPLILMSGTMNRAMQQQLTSQMPSYSGFLEIRMNTNRPNISIEVIEKPVFAECLRYLNNIVLRSSGHGVVYFMAIERLETVYRSMSGLSSNIFKYHSQLQDQERDNNYTNWLQNPNGWMLASSGFGAGINVSDIRHVVIMPFSYTMEAMAQQIGRGGRDGHPAKATILLCEDDLLLSPENKQIQSVISLIKSKNCRRYDLSLFLDGWGTFCSSKDTFAKCDICKTLDEDPDNQHHEEANDDGNQIFRHNDDESYPFSYNDDDDHPFVRNTDDSDAETNRDHPPNIDVHEYHRQRPLPTSRNDNFGQYPTGNSTYNTNRLTEAQRDDSTLHFRASAMQTQARLSANTLLVKELQHLLEEFAGLCPFCLLKRRERNIHSYIRCPNNNLSRSCFRCLRSDCRSNPRCFTYSDGQCSSCFLPSVLEEVLFHSPGMFGGRNCNSKGNDLLRPLVLLVYHDPDIWPVILRHYPNVDAQRLSNFKEFNNWCTEYDRNPYCNLVALAKVILQGLRDIIA